MKITKFSDIVGGITTRRISESKLGFYAKRLAKETSTRRLASGLLVGLLVFQFFTFIVPPKASKASISNNNIIRNGITNTSNQGVLDVFKNTGAIQLIYQAGISDQDILAGQANQPFCRSAIPNMVSMGRQGGAGSWLYPGHNDIFLGSPNTRWLQDCFSGLKGTNKIFADIGQGGPQWYEWGILYDCGNLVFIPTSPPPPEEEPEKIISCTSLDATPLSVQINQPIKLTGHAQGENIPAGESVKMSYLVFSGNDITSVNTTPLVTRLDSEGIVAAANGSFTDDTPKDFVTATAGTYTILLAVGYDSGTKLAAGSGINLCKAVITVTPEPLQASVVCQNLNVSPASVPVTGGAITMTGTARLNNSTEPELADFEYYLRERRADGTFDDATVDARGRHQIDSAGISHNAAGIYTDTRPPQSDPNGTFIIPANTENVAKTYQIFLRVFWRGHVAVSDAFSVPACAKLITVPPLPPNQPSFLCQSLTSTAVFPEALLQEVPFQARLTAIGTATNTAITGYDFNFGDGQTQSVNTNSTTTTVEHTYAQGGKFTATVVVRTAAGTTTIIPACSTEIITRQIGFAKVVANLTLLTDDGKPTDANGQVAKAGDSLRYTIGVQNKGGDVLREWVFEDDVTDILAYADITDLGGAQLVKAGATSKLVWPPVDLPANTSNAAEPQTITKQFTVKIKDPIPDIAQKTTDVAGFNDCNMKDTFHGAIVTTPLGVSLNKQIECTTKELPQTGAGLPIFFVAFFAASSAFLFFRNRLLKRELQLVETLNEPGGPANA